MREVIAEFFYEMADYGGRMDRGNFLKLVLFAFVGWIVASLVIGPAHWPFFLIRFALGMALLAAGVRRLHDSNRTGLWVLLAVPLFAAVLVHDRATSYFTRDQVPAWVKDHLFDFSLASWVALGVLALLLLMPSKEGLTRFDRPEDAEGPEERRRRVDPDAPPHRPVFDFGPAREGDRDDDDPRPGNGSSPPGGFGRRK